LHRTRNSSAIERLLEAQLMKARMAIEAGIERFLNENIEARVLDVANYIVSGGKRFRGALALLVSDLLNGNRELAISSAIAIELVHASSLAIDDIIDLDYCRRGGPSAWVAHGVSKTVLVSNLLIPHAQMLVEPLGELAVHEVIDSWLRITKGEILDVFEENAPYEDVVVLKTSSLFQLALALGCLSANRPELIPVLKEYGRILGMAYQVADDIVDFHNIEKKGWREALSLKKFVKWLGLSNADGEEKATVLRVGKDRLKGLVELATDVALAIEAKELGSYLAVLPYFMVSRMLEEGGLDLGF